MSRNFLLYSEALNTFTESEEFFCALVPKVVAFNIDILTYNHYIYKVIIRQNRIISIDDKDIYEELAEPLNNSFTACFFEDKDLALYWKYMYTQQFIKKWDDPEFDYSNVRDVIYETINYDLINNNITNSTFNKFEYENPDKILSVLSKLDSTRF